MAGYSDQREQNMEMKYLRKVLSEVDQQIQVPDSVRGAALRRKLDDIKPGVYGPDMLRNLLRDRPRMLTWQSGLSYVLALAFIVGLSYMLGINSDRSSVMMGNPAITQEEPAQAQPAPELAAFGLEQEQEVAVDEAVPADDGSHDTGAAAPRGAVESPAAAFSELEEPLGVGGGGRSTHLATEQGYTYNWRPNDASDPDKGDYPVTIDIVDDKGEQLVAQIDIPDMVAVNACYVERETLILVGESGQGAVVRTYDVSDKEAPREGMVHQQPGEYVDSRISGGMLHLATRYQGELAGSVEREELPNSGESVGCVLTVLDPEAQDSVTKAFPGVDGAIDLHNISAYVTYSGVGEDGESEETHIAHIHMEDFDIWLGSVSE